MVLFEADTASGIRLRRSICRSLPVLLNALRIYKDAALTGLGPNVAQRPPDACRKLLRGEICGLVNDGSRVEHDHVGASDGEHAPIG